MSIIVKKFLGITIKFWKLFQLWHFKVLIISAEMGETKNLLFRSNKDGPNIKDSIFAYFIYQNWENYVQSFQEPFEVQRF